MGAILLLLFFLTFLTSAAADAAVSVPQDFPPSGRLVYDIWRDGSVIGRNQVDFEKNGDRLTVHTVIDIEVKVLFVPVYRFEHDAVEQWVDGKLVRFRAVTDDNGKDRDVLLERVGDELRGHYNNDQRALPGDLLPGSLWHPATVDQTQLIEPTKGRARQVTVIDRGLEMVDLGGRKVEAHHYSITGEFRREVWYAADGTVVQAAFPARDESLVTLKLRQSTLAQRAAP